jgi:hypothetical protein
MKNLIRFITIVFATITLSALLAHLMELPGKIYLSKENYQLVQQIYRGWAWLGIFEIGAILLTLVWAIVESKKTIFSFLLIAFLLFSSSLVIFFIYTFPANNITLNWTQLPGNWENLRKQWEYSHAVRTFLNFAGFCLLIIALLKDKNNSRKKENEI